jgi:hypothetical protein
MTLTSNIQRHQCRVDTQQTGHRLASSVADVVVYSHTTTTTTASYSMCTTQQPLSPCTASAVHKRCTISIKRTSDGQRRQRRVHTQCAAQRLASSIADLVHCSHTTTAAQENASNSTCATQRPQSTCEASATHRRHPATSASSSHAAHRTTTRIQHRRCRCLLSHNYSSPRRRKPLDAQNAIRRPSPYRF